MYPQQLVYTKCHQWISFEEQYAFVGITDFAQKKLANIMAMNIPYLNQTVSRQGFFVALKLIKQCWTIHARDREDR